MSSLFFLLQFSFSFSHRRRFLKARHEPQPGLSPRAKAGGLSQEELLAAGSSVAAAAGVVVVLCSGGGEFFDLVVVVAVGRSRNRSSSSSMLRLALLLDLLLLGVDAPSVCATHKRASATACRRTLSRIRRFVVLIFFVEQRR